MTADLTVLPLLTTDYTQEVESGTPATHEQHKVVFVL